MPGYQELFRSGKLGTRVREAESLLKNCRLCGLVCGVDRVAGELGRCKTGTYAVVSNYGPHFGEEAPLVGTGGSGAIFFTNCNLKCVYCQNYAVSQSGKGQEVSADVLAQMMLDLEKRGCHNINLVSPTHQISQILEALQLAAAGGLSLPLVYNTGGYDSPEALALLDGVIDIYMPDMKYSDEKTALELSRVKDYPAVNRGAVKEMHRQVGELVLDERGVARRGLLVRHLLLPDGLAGTEGVVTFLAREVSVNTYLNIMSQYRPCYGAFQFPGLMRTVGGDELMQAVKLAYDAGLNRLHGFCVLDAASDD